MVKRTGHGLVVGAGIAGVRAALDLAETGLHVTLIDRADHLGGLLAQLDYQYPTNRCGMCRMLPLVDRDSASQHCLRKGFFHENVDLILGADMSEVKGEAGRFIVRLNTKPQLIDPAKCVGCGLCEKACPVEVEDPFNLGLAPRKAAYRPTPHLFPNRFAVDTAACTFCGECAKVCPTGAIDLAKGGKDYRILVVDDELVMRDSLKEWLNVEGYPTEMTASGPEALSMLERNGYDLMLLDVKMPGMDGVEVLRRAKEMSPGLVVIMMTAYATVETAVEAMKIGALNYLLKPFDPERLFPLVEELSRKKSAAKGPELEVGAIILAGGASFFDLRAEGGSYGYGSHPDVVTGLEFERILSPAGPTKGRLLRPSNGQPVKKAAWLQCVGSRNVSIGADFCSTVCCMNSIKEAWLAKENTDGVFETTIFYMDLRTPNKSFQRYRDRAEAEAGVRFVRTRIHSVESNAKTGGMKLAWVNSAGGRQEEDFDLVVLAQGQRPAAGIREISEMLDLELNEFGFLKTDPSSLAKTGRPGIFVAGSVSGLRDVSESLILASSAALEASRIIREAGGGRTLPTEEPESRDVGRESARILIALCTCGGKLGDLGEIEKALRMDPAVQDIVRIERLCTETGWAALLENIRGRQVNRILVGACDPLVQGPQIRKLGPEIRLPATLVEAVSIYTPSSFIEERSFSGDTAAPLLMGLAGLKHANPYPAPSVEVIGKALVIGGGPAGLTAAIALADHGYPVDLVEKNDRLGGNLVWLGNTLEGEPLGYLRLSLMERVQKNDRIAVHLNARIKGACGSVGGFVSTIESADAPPLTVEHAVTILATGGRETDPTGYGRGQGGAVITQKELEEKIGQGLSVSNLRNVVMIQCAGTREEPRNYCSRVCCTTSLKHALHLKKENPAINVYVLYRDLNSYGFTEKYYTQARKEGVVFIPYSKDEKPRVDPKADKATVSVRDPILGRSVEIEADLVVLASGISPDLPADLVEPYGGSVDRDGFFQEADEKWRPVDAMAEGVFACGICLGPRNVADSINTAQAAAQRALRILSREKLPAGKVTAKVRHALCSLCQACIPACPYGARSVDLEWERIEVNPAMCQGCGSCASACPNSASIVEGFADPKIFEVIDAAVSWGTRS